MVELMLYGPYAVLGIFWVFVVRQLIQATHLFRTKKMPISTKLLEDLPSVSVCIPARNEMHVMTECLERIIANTYPKLEIIVLDDSSHDETSTLIKAYAHEGVRFVEGTKLPRGWLGKNHALQGLLNEASGKIVLFLDVDTRIEPDTIEQLVAYKESEKVKMLSIMPRRDDQRASVIFSTLRYFWELLFHRDDAPATASNAWMIDRQTLLDMGGFAPIKEAIQPETQLSAQLMAKHEYRFLIGTRPLGVSYEKKWQSQIETGVRLSFPLLKGNIGYALLTMIGLLFLLWPICVLILIPLTGWTIAQVWALIAFGAFALSYGFYLKQVWSHGWWLGALLWPVIVFQEFLIVLVSVERYARHEVRWKGRSVTSDAASAGKPDTTSSSAG